MAFVFANESMLTSVEQLNYTGVPALPMGLDPYRSGYLHVIPSVTSEVFLLIHCVRDSWCISLRKGMESSQIKWQEFTRAGFL
jgi:hypothetical protein